MAGSNPYIKSPEAGRPQQKYTITFLPEKRVVEVDPNDLPSSGTGLPGSVLDIALAMGIDIDHACGGVCACSTCHVIVREGLNTCSPSTEDEDDQLEKAPGLTSQSRLACQCVASGEENLVVEIPSWNRNRVRE
jgi:2Fe-2S ferredoxin